MENHGIWTFRESSLILLLFVNRPRTIYRIFCVVYTCTTLRNLVVSFCFRVGVDRSAVKHPQFFQFCFVYQSCHVFDLVGVRSRKNYPRPWHCPRKDILIVCPYNACSLPSVLPLVIHSHCSQLPNDPFLPSACHFKGQGREFADRVQTKKKSNRSFAFYPPLLLLALAPEMYLASGQTAKKGW